MFAYLSFVWYSVWRQGSWSRGILKHHHLPHSTLQGLHLGDQPGVNVQEQELR